MLKKAVMAICVLALMVAASPAFASLTSVNETPMVFDSQEDIEPVVISQNVGTTEYDIAVWMRFDPNIQTATSKLYFSVKTSSGTAVASGQIPTLSPYVQYADPWLTTNGSRIFLTGLGINTSNNTRAVIVWYSDDQGQTWAHTGSSPSAVNTTSSTDKPTCTVAPNGTVYVSYVIGGGQGIWVQSSTQQSNGTWNAWSTAARVGTTTLAQSPTVLVDSSNVPYVVYTNDTNSTNLGIEIAKWNGTSFATLTQKISTPNALGSSSPYFLTLDTTTSPAVSVRADTVPVARIDRSSGRISVVWHEGDGSGHIVVHFSAIKPNDATPTWRTITVGSTTDANINAAMDHDSSGGYLVTYYHFSTSGASSVYTTYGVYVSFPTETPASDSNQTITGRTGSPAYYTDSPANTGERYLGDYHDVYFSNGTFKVCGILVNGWGDPWVYTITHP